MQAGETHRRRERSCKRASRIDLLVMPYMHASGTCKSFEQHAPLPISLFSSLCSMSVLYLPAQNSAGLCEWLVLDASARRRLGCLSFSYRAHSRTLGLRCAWFFRPRASARIGGLAIRIPGRGSAGPSPSWRQLGNTMTGGEFYTLVGLRWQQSGCRLPCLQSSSDTLAQTSYVIIRVALDVRVAGCVQSASSAFFREATTIG